MSRFGRYTQAELAEAQGRYGLTFPPDLIDLLREQEISCGYEWTTEDSRIREMLEWPFELLRFDVEHNSWWPRGWERPGTAEQRAVVLREVLAAAPKLIPLSGHRFLPEFPHEAGNPVFSMHGFDTIYYGANLAEWLTNERDGLWRIGPVRKVPFWSDLVDQFASPI